ncbi:MAG: YceI family protein [Nitrospira sp.]|nr:MAG: YceI family protein [Nitrospira sp.]
MHPRVLSSLVVIAASILVGAWSRPAAAERYTVDSDHTIIGFSVAHMVVAKTTGRFTDYTGLIDMDPETKTVKAIEAVIKTASINTNQEKRDTHLRSPDFFNVEKHPTMIYRMTTYAKQGDLYVAKGDLTLLGVTKEIVLTGTFNGVLPKDPRGLTRAGFSAQGKINRKDFGMVWNKLLDNGGVAVGDDVEIRLEIECIKQP